MRGGRHGGFSLIETLAALAIFSVAIVGIIQGIATALGQWRLAEEKTKALMLAENVMEEILYNEDMTLTEDGGDYEPPNHRFSWESNISETEIEGLFEVTVRIKWAQESRHGGWEVSLTTLKANRGRKQWQYEPEA